jgi:hypothetical protein
MKKLIFFLAFISLLQFCCIEKNNLGDMKLSDNQKKFVSFKGNETLKYTNQTGNEMIFIGKGREVNTEKWDATAKESCDYYKVETDVTTFESAGNYKFEFKLLGAEFRGSTPSEYFMVYAYFQGDDYSQMIFDLPVFKTNPCANASTNFTCNYPFTIGNISYSNVYRFETEVTLGYDGTSKRIKTIYYSIKEGLLRFELDNGDIWTLSK